ncbi:cilia and flagella-associated protein 47-like isoform X1 [Athalia rosae]|uniref:cilia and flagella-associated protein 47-like isoform X1 n=1 Tax=Athalia rosae TaxID=37344 RepID=UPI0020347286|nr:cilia and flagella-associated protein 47-like isoform X1 [Athalia rosae]
MNICQNKRSPSPTKMQMNEKGDDANVGGGSMSMARADADILNANTALNIKANYIEYDSVRLSPRYMEFKDALEGMTFRQLFIIQNMGKHPAHIRICAPNSIAFKIKTLQRGMFLSPGLRILRWVHYSYKRTSVLHTMIPIYINWNYIDYHVICTQATEKLSIEPSSLDFGLVDIGSTSGIKILTLKNDGGKTTRFAIDLGPNEIDLSIKPMRGLVHAHSKILLRVEVIGVEEGTLVGEFWIKSSRNIQVPVKVNIIIPRLVVYHPNTTGDFTLIDFPSTFAGTTRRDTLILRSLSAQVSNFVVLGEIDSDLIPIKNINVEKHPAFQVFSIHPHEGRMDPFEGRVFNIAFSPTIKVIKDLEELRKQGSQDFMVFVRIFRVHCTEVEDIIRKEIGMDDRVEEPFKKVQLLEPGSAESLALSENEAPEPPGYETVRLCLYGVTEEPRLNFVPDEYHFGDISLGETVGRELTISNPSPSISVVYKFVPTTGVRCQPTSGRINQKDSHQVLVTVIGNYNVKPPFKIAFDIIVKTCMANDAKPSFVTAKRCRILGWYNLVTPPVKDSLKKENNHQVVNASYFSDLNVEYALTPEEAEFRSRHHFYWSDYLRLRRTRKRATILKNPVVEYFEPITDCKDLMSAKLPKIKEISAAKTMLGKAAALKVVNKARDEMLVPLSPLQIYNVKIAPTVLAYDSVRSFVVIFVQEPYCLEISVIILMQVAPKSTNYRTLRVENLNAFPVMLRLISLVSKAISFPNGSLIILQPGEQTTKIVEYRAQRLGKFNTYIDYVINDNHSFAMTITANVVVKSLNLNVKQITFGKEYLPREAYQPSSLFVEIKNKLDANTSFLWDLRSNCSFSVYPMSGEVRGNRTLFAEVTYDPVSSKSSNTEAVMTSESGTWVNLKIDVVPKKPDVAFINETINLDRIPLNMATTINGVLHNAEFSEVTFQVDQSKLVCGCEVFPQHGIIPPRGIVILEVKMRFDACFKFSITVDVLVQKCLQLQMKLIGQVSYPMLKLSPETISMKRISVDAFATHLLTASNDGKTILKVEFLLDEYPGFNASLSPHREDPDSKGLTIAPGASVSIYLHFIPIDVASYAFYLPIVINEIIGPAALDGLKSIKPSDFLKPRESYYAHFPGIEITELPQIFPTVFVDCTVSGHVISFSQYIFSFDFASNKVEDKLQIFNETVQEVSFIIRIDDFTQLKSPFTITWISGVKPTFTSVSIFCTLQPQEEIIFLLEFKPFDYGKFKIEAPIFVRGELQGDIFSSLILSGRKLVSCIVSDKRELYFAPVPLGVETEQKLMIKVCRCENNHEIKAVVIKPKKLNGTYSDNCILVKFLKGNVITGNESNEELEVYVTFRSEFPVAFSTDIEFRVGDVAACSIRVCVIADNCILTTYGYLRGGIEHNGFTRPAERYSYPSISSRGENSSSLTKQEIAFEEHIDSATKRLSIQSGISGTSQKSFKNTEIRSGHSQNDENLENNYEGVSLNSKILSALPPVFDHYIKLSMTGYPYFPIIKSGETDSHSQRTLTAAEQWMFASGFKFNFYPSIVDGITGVMSGVCSITSTFSDRRKAHTVNQSFIDILVSLAGTDVLKYIGDPSEIPKNPMDRASYTLKLYENALKFLEVQGAFLPHVNPEFLLSYNDYLLNDPQGRSILADQLALESDTIVWPEKMLRDLFQARSKQYWLDVALQTFKTLVLQRVSLKNLKEITKVPWNQRDSSESGLESSTLSVLEYLASKESAQDGTRDKTEYSTEETLLLNWLDYHFERQQFEGWMMDDRVNPNPQARGDVIESRKVSNFESDLADGLVLIAVTAAHCSYLIPDHFKNIYITPRNVEEIHHNAICLTAAWRKIRLGFMITPAQITSPNCVQMVMLVTHLFRTLPTYLPSAKVQFCCPLSETLTRQISFTNATDYTVSYLFEFIGNEMNLFTAVTSKPVITLDAHGTGSFKIQFCARKIADTQAHIILCGSSIAPNFASNQVFILEGCTSYLGVINKYEFEKVLYKVCDETLKIPVPFEESAEYEISLSEEQPTTPG